MIEFCNTLNKLYKNEPLNEKEKLYLQEWSALKGINDDDFINIIYKNYVTQEQVEESSIRHLEWLKNKKTTNCCHLQSNWRGRMLFDLKFDNQDLREANFAGVLIENTLFSNSNLRKSNFYCTLLLDVDFRNVDLRGAEFSGTTIHNVTFKNCKIDIKQHLIIMYRRLISIVS